MIRIFHRFRPFSYLTARFFYLLADPYFILPIILLYCSQGEDMKIRVELSDRLPEDEIVVQCGRISPAVEKICQNLQEEVSSPPLVFYQNNEEHYFPLQEVLFFETEGDVVYAHTVNDAYRIKFRLYELENILPRDFIRVSKSTILNVRHIRSIERNLTSSSLVRFHQSHKQVYVSRLYYKSLKQRLGERKE